MGRRRYTRHYRLSCADCRRANRWKAEKIPAEDLKRASMRLYGAQEAAALRRVVHELDPRIHVASPPMDCRIKSGNDDE
jgi:hypothetical protein